MAANMAAVTIYNLPPSPPNWDRVGVFYISFCVTWSALLMAGMLFCWFNRHIHIVKIRGISLSFTAIALLHVYWTLGQVTYTIRATMPTVLASDVQYFAMSIYFPFGIALFQASNMRFLHISKMQKQFAHPDFRNARKVHGGTSSLLSRLRNMDYMNRTLLLIGLGMILQVCIFYLLRIWYFII